MGILTSDLQKILEEETDLNSPVSEQLFTKIGSSLNGLIDLAEQGWEVFLANDTWTAPEGITRVDILGAGGGASGSGGGGSDQGDGGAGCNLMFVSVPVTPLTTYNITIGAGGSSATAGSFTGNAGGDTIFGPNLAVFSGAPSSIISGSASTEGESLSFNGCAYNLGGAGRSDGSTSSGVNGTRSIYASGGAGGPGGGAGQLGAGGGGAGFGVGGDANQTSGGSGANGGISAGGGGVAGGVGGTTSGAGGNGILLIRPS